MANSPLQDEPIERLNYVHGRLLSPEDLQGEQEYFRRKLQRHNRLLHGWGVVEGLAVDIERSPTGERVTVSPGFALDALGNEIWLPAPVSMLLPAGDPGDVIWLGIFYREEEAGPLPGSTGDEKNNFGWIRETFLVDFLNQDPASLSNHQSGELSPVPLACLRFSRIRWRLDTGFRPKSIR